MDLWLPTFLRRLGAEQQDGWLLRIPWRRWLRRKSNSDGAQPDFTLSHAAESSGRLRHFLAHRPSIAIESGSRTLELDEPLHS